MKKKSIAVNAGLNAVKTICGFLFPLVTFPYVSRVLQVENMGRYSFCTSIINYVLLLAGLGISTYAIREGAGYRDSAEQMSAFASEVFSLNLLSTLFSYLLLFVAVAAVPKLRENRLELFVLSISVLFTTLGCDWIFSVYEEFAYITIRSIAVQLFSLVMLFAFVHTGDDLLRYMVIHVIATSGANVMNALARRRYCKIRFTVSRSMLRRLKPILILFASNVATSVYVNSDMTMLGAISGDYSTGLYSVSTKLYSIMKGLLSAVIIVSVPRLSAALGRNDRAQYSQTAAGIFEALLILVTPVMTGLFSIAQNAIVILAGKEYLDAALSLRLLAVALLFCLFGWFYTSCVLIPNKKESKVLIATIAAAAANIVLNLIWIPVWNHNAAAMTTVIAELISMLLCYVYGRKCLTIRLAKREWLLVLLGNVFIFVVCFLSGRWISPVWLSTFVSISVSAVGYIAIVLKIKSPFMTTVQKVLAEKLRLPAKG